MKSKYRLKPDSSDSDWIPIFFATLYLPFLSYFREKKHTDTKQTSHSLIFISRICNLWEGNVFSRVSATQSVILSLYWEVRLCQEIFVGRV